MIDMRNTNPSMLSDFVDKMEIVYAILIALGFTKLACDCQYSWHYWQLLIISTMILIRFFFAPSRNLMAIAKATENRPFWQRVLFFWDIPVLIAHSFIFFIICAYRIDKNIDGYVYYHSFYLYFLVLNVIWLWSISIRLYYFHEKIPSRFLKWSFNNFIHILIFLALRFLGKSFNIDITGKHLILLFFLSLSNCSIDFLLTAPAYLGFGTKRE